MVYEWSETPNTTVRSLRAEKRLQELSLAKSLDLKFH